MSSFPGVWWPECEVGQKFYLFQSLRTSEATLYSMFVVPGIVNVFFLSITNKMQRYTIFYIIVNAYMFWAVFRPSSGAQELLQQANLAHTSCCVYSS
jgi:hypothetical protein